MLHHRHASPKSSLKQLNMGKAAKLSYKQSDSNKKIQQDNLTPKLKKTNLALVGAPASIQ